jgi:hypothetical protein
MMLAFRHQNTVNLFTQFLSIYAKSKRMQGSGIIPKYNAGDVKVRLKLTIQGQTWPRFFFDTEVF